jgi:hypothetical protein
MGKLTKMTYRSHWRLTRIWKGGFLTYAENQLDAIKEMLVNFQQRTDTKAEVIVLLPYSSGQVSTVTTTSLLNQTKIINSFRLPSFIFMMRPLLRGYLMISWTSLLPGGMSQRDHSPTWFKVWAHYSRLPTFGQ